jgi:PAS domain S-box-containing protein
MYNFFPYIGLLILSFVTMIIFSIYGLYHREKVGVKEFIFAMLASAWWVFCQAFELMAVTLPVKLFWANLLYIGAGLSAFAYLMLVMRFSGHERLLTKKSISLVLVIYVVFFSLVFTDQYHGLMRTNFSLDTSAIPYIIDKNYGLVFPAYILFIYSMNVSSLGLLFKTMLNKASHYRKQAAILFAGLGIVALSNLSYNLGLLPGQRFDMAPALFGLSALVVFWGVFQYKLLNIMPIARSVLVEMMNSGIIVLDKDNFIVDINHAAQEMFHLGESEMVGENITTIPFFAESLLPVEQAETQTTLNYSHGNNKFVYEIKKHPFNEKGEKRAGILYIINDITEQQKNLHKLIQQQKTLSIMRERERLGRELHDGLGQMFGYYSVQAQTVKEYMNQQKYETAIKKLEDLICVSRETHNNIRDYILEIRGIPPRNRSFSATLKHYVAGFTEKYGLPVTVTFSEDLPGDFPEETRAIQLLRIIQEALNNILKHAGKCSARISFSSMEGFLEIKISDTGKGFDQDKHVDKYHYGISIMQERAKEIGADFAINSEQGKGTEIILRILDGEV